LSRAREDWRLGDLEAPQATAKIARRGTEQLVPGSVTLIYLGQEGEQLGRLTRDCLFPMVSEQVRTAVEGRELVASFPVRAAVDGESLDATGVWFRVDADEWQRASVSDRKRAVEAAAPVASLALYRQLAPLPKRAVGRPPSRRRIDYGDGRSAIVTDGESKRIDFDDGDSVTVTELPEGPSDLPARAAPRYLIPRSFKLQIFDSEGRRVGLTTGTRYRAGDAMRDDDR
jgi:hypothetical protein